MRLRRRMLYALALFGCPHEPEAAPVSVAPPVAEEAVMCPSPWKIDHHDSVLSEQRGKGPSWSDFPVGFPAAAITGDDVPVAVTAPFQIEGAPILYFRPGFSEAVVDARWSGAWTAVDATGLAAGSTAVVARLTPEGRAGLSAARWAELLVRAGMIQTYAHIGAEVCLVEETLPDGAWRGVLRGEHVYFTNEENHAPLAFAVVVAPDGEIRVTGL